ncbi:MAG: hypothetical protein IJ642_08495 [Oscillospiraceae bacterium]|nr:hypothetical protein [Oscillospiraceae bacterium]
MKKIKKILTGLILHTLLSLVIFNLLLVYQRGYNTTHQEKIRMAGISLQEDGAEIQILHYQLPVILPAENSPFWYQAYLLTDTPFHVCLSVLEFIKNS